MLNHIITLVYLGDENITNELYPIGQQREDVHPIGAEKD